MDALSRHALDRHAIGQLLRAHDIDAWGVAANTPQLPHAPDLPIAIAMLMHIDPDIAHSLRYGPSDDYLREYLRLNAALDDATTALVESLRTHGHAASTVPRGGRSVRFAHKTAATCAGMGWIGKTALFISPEFGPAVRLATVFTDLDLPAGEAITESLCGDCRACVDACPGSCGRDVQWHAGMPLEDLLDVTGCRRQTQRVADSDAHLCGICIAACPYTKDH